MMNKILTEIFFKVPKMKRKETLGDKPTKRRGRPGHRKYNFVTTWDPIFQT